MSPTNKDALWYKDAIIYQVHVRTFYDSNGDGIGDFLGLDQKLDYLQELGINTIWLMPFFPSPLRDDGYDIADYDSVHSSYGTLEDFKKFLESAHERGIRVIIEMVLNHTSDQHPWFQEVAKFAGQSRAGIGMSGVIPTPGITKPGSFFSTPRCPTGRGIRFRNPIIGIAFSATSPI